jgi:hypothetical protein
MMSRQTGVWCAVRELSPDSPRVPAHSYALHPLQEKSGDGDEMGWTDGEHPER